MNRTMIAAVTAALLSARELRAQWNVANFDAAPNRTYATFGLDPAMIGSLGYGRVVDVLGHPWQLTGEAGVVTARLDLHDFRTRLGTETSLARWRSVRLAGSLAWVTRGTTNAIYRGFDFGADAGATLGLYRRRWFAAGELGKDKAIITHVTHTAYYRDNFYADAKDGWYLDAGGTVRAGAAAGVSLGRTEVTARAGVLRTERLAPVTTPGYVTIGIGRAF